MTTIYERLGGSFRKMEMIVAQFYQYLLSDDRVNLFIIERVTDIARSHRTFTEFLVKILGGPDCYTGKDVGELHKTMPIQTLQFDAVWEHL